MPVGIGGKWQAERGSGSGQDSTGSNCWQGTDIQRHARCLDASSPVNTSKC